MYGEFPPDAIVVQKYGGTSVGTVERIRLIAERAYKHRELGRTRFVIVVSAMAGETNRLVELVRQVNPKASPKSYDMAVAAGEQVSAGLVAAALEARGLPADPMLGYQLGIFTDSDFSKAKIRHIDIKRVQESWERGRVPVIAGFQGVTSEGHITTLGRGGSDTSAVALAAALGASFCEINTDVDGIFTADPRIVPAAQHVGSMHAEVAMELAALGGKVLHSRCVEIAQKFQVPLVVRNSFSPDEARRTFVIPGPVNDLEAPVVSAVTLDRDVVKFTVRGLPDTRPEMLSELFVSLANEGVNVDIIVYDRRQGGKVRIGFTTTALDVENANVGLKKYQEVHGLEGLKWTCARDLVKVSAVGLGMRSHSGVAAKVFSTLSRNQVEVVMVSTSEIKISCVVPAVDGEKAVRAIHEGFFTAQS